jgi:valyl-tRNA synthetase
VMDTWATSSLTPQIAGQWSPVTPSSGGELYDQVFPMSLRPQAHDIIRTWAFYTITKSLLHFGVLPWREVAISGWGIAGEGMGKISKSRGGGPIPPLEAIERYSSDAVRYWAASTGLGKDAVISEDKMQVGARLVNKLWNVARFVEPFLDDQPAQDACSCPIPQALSPADRWILAKTQRLVRRATGYLLGSDYAAAKSEAESFLWSDLADNYLEMCKTRLYGSTGPGREAACYTLQHVVLVLIKLLAPYLPHVTEEIYQSLFAEAEGLPSIHISRWPTPDVRLEDTSMEETGAALVAIATAVRRYKSEHNLPLGTELRLLHLAAHEPAFMSSLCDAEADLKSVTRARQVQITSELPAELDSIHSEPRVTVAVSL